MVDAGLEDFEYYHLLSELVQAAEKKGVDAHKEAAMGGGVSGSLYAVWLGTIATKDLRLEGHGTSTITLLAPETLEVCAPPFALPEGSMGRIAAYREGSGEWILVAGTEHLWRAYWNGTELRLDDAWRPRYREAGDRNGLAWDSCVAAGAVWSMDNGDIDSVRLIFGTRPNWGRGPPH